jgi:hypothetical protein
MGCGCGKQNTQDNSKVVPKGITPIQVQAVQPEPVTYTIEELIRIKDYISSTNKNETERHFVETFMINKAGLVIPSYCDQICLSNLRDKVQQMESRLK